MTKKSKPTKIIGIDPGTTVLGYAIVQIEQPINRVDAVGVIRLNKYPDHYTKLKIIFEKLTFIIQTHQPTEMAIEAPFFGKNVQSMLKLGRAQGVAITTAMLKDIPVTEYAPRKIKQAITGNGNASKEQISAMLKSMLQLDRMPKYFDATDALGVAICHHLQMKSPFYKLQKGKKKMDWKGFLKENPDKIL